MTTLLECAKDKKITSDIRQVAKAEHVSFDTLRRKIAAGTVTIPHNPLHRIKKLCGIGAGLSVKINANIGTSLAASDIKVELKKLKVAQDAGADTVMDLSTGKDIKSARQAIMANARIPVGTVPIYQAAVSAIRKRGDVKYMDEEGLFRVLEEQAKDGVDFFTIHCGVTLSTVRKLKKANRVLDVVSRGGALLVSWMNSNKKENPLYENFDEVLKIAKRYDVTLSLGDGLRPGSICDSTDAAQIGELAVLGKLAKRARQAGVQVIIEGPGHIPLNDIEKNIRLQKKLCDGAPFYVLGPLVTDAAPGYDHITSSIGGALAAWYGADFLCYVTPSEHMGLPTVDDVRQGVIASRIAAHAADVAHGIPRAIAQDRAISLARKKRDWPAIRKYSIDTNGRWDKMAMLNDTCSMCDEYCSMKLIEKCMKQK